MPAGELLQLARSLKPITRGKALLIINDRVDVADGGRGRRRAATRAGLPTRTARGIVGRYALLGRSVHDAEAASHAARDGAEFVVAGTIYKSRVEAGREAGRPRPDQGDHQGQHVAGDRHRRHHGGQGRASVVKAGAAGVAVISAIAGAEDRKAAAEELARRSKTPGPPAPDAVRRQRVTAQTISLTLNGKPRSLPGETPLLDLLDGAGRRPAPIAVAHNGDVDPARLLRARRPARRRPRRGRAHGGRRLDVADVVIVGGGIIGCATAYYLAREGVARHGPRARRARRRGLGRGGGHAGGALGRGRASRRRFTQLCDDSLRLYDTLLPS